MTEEPLDLPTWPHEADVAISLTFDVDAESGVIGQSLADANRLTSLSEARYAITRAVPRLLALLASCEVNATFYVPGHTAELHPHAVQAIVEAGHEVGHHGHHHLISPGPDAATQRAEIEQGIAALGAITGRAPAGYRSPGWELTPETLRLLREYEFEYDSSAMGDDRPYELVDGDWRLLELPVHWSLDDVPYFAFSSQLPSRYAPLETMRLTWLQELANARDERRMVTLTMHPEIIGRGYRALELHRLITDIQEEGRAWFATHSDVAQLIRNSDEAREA